MDSTLDSLLSAVLHASTAPATEPSTSLLTEVKRLPSFYEMVDDEADFENIRIVYRLGTVDRPGFGITDLHLNQRFEGLLEEFRIKKLEREFGFTFLEADKFCDWAWNFRWMFLNVRNKQYAQELALNRILDMVDMDVPDTVVREQGS